MVRSLTALSLLRSNALSYIVVLLVSAAQAQITNVTGDQAAPIQGAGHDYIKMLNETVNPGTGSVSIRIDVPTPPSRGFRVPFAFGYDSNQALHYTGPNAWRDNSNQINGQSLGKGGWTYVVPSVSVALNAYASGQGTNVCYFFTDYMMTDLALSTHALGISPIETIDPSGLGKCGSWGTYNVSNALAGSDAQVQATTTAIPMDSLNVMIAVTAVDLDGTVYSFAGGDQVPATFVPNWIEDRNGNKAVFNWPMPYQSGKFSITDTAGRAALSSSGFGNSGDTVTVSGLSGAYTVTWTQFQPTSSFPFVGVFNNCNGSGPAGGFLTPDFVNPIPVITKIKLPNGQSYTFQYDPVTNLLSKLVYPTGGYVRYTWGMTSTVWDTLYWSDNSGYRNNNCSATYENFVLQHRYVSFDGVHEVLQQDFSYVTTGAWTQRQTTVTTRDLLRGTNSNTVYTYVPFPVPIQPNDVGPLHNSTPVETSVAYYGTTGSLLRTVTKSYVDPHLPPDVTTTLENSQTSKIHNAYISRPSGTACIGTTCTLGVLSDKYEYDFGSGAPGGLLRQTHIDYASFTDTPIFASAPSILDRPSDVITYDGSSNKMAETDYAYDQSGVGPVSATGHDDTNYPSTSGIVRGNATTQTIKCLQTGCPNAVTTYIYDQTGQVTSKVDPCGNGTCSDLTGTNHTSTYSYADSYTVLSGGQNVSYTSSGNTNAYVTKVTDPLGHTANFTYDFNNGQLTALKDANGQSTTYLYNDLFSRPTLINYPDGGQTEATYNDASPSPSVTTCQLINGTAGAACSSTSPPIGWKTTLALMDGLGHEVQAKLISDPDGATFTAMSYDGLGKIYQAWNPTRCSPPTTNCGTETTWGITTYTYDALGRTTTVSKPDGSAATSSYSGNQTTVTDEGLNQRKSQTDALGRLTAVWEAPNKTAYNFETDYQYDALGNLLCAVQKGTDTTAFTACSAAPATWRPRSFVYDSLSRLTSTSNPESGAISYSYDLNGNLSTKTSPAPNQIQTGTAKVTLSYCYDALNRMTSKAYTAQPCPASSPAASYSYDQATAYGLSITNPIGHRTGMSDASGTSAWSYDKMGRAVALQRTINGFTRNATYQYNLDGSMALNQIFSSKQLQYTYNGAGRPVSVVDPTSTPTFNFVTSAQYAPQGALASAVFALSGTFAGITETDTYNNRLQPIQRLASSSNGTALSLNYDFHLGAGDNGDVFQIVNNRDGNRTQNFMYDPLNRIQQAYTNGPNWGETFGSTATAPGVAPPTPGIDAWGNLNNRSGVTGKTYYEPLSASATTHNQLTGFGYDPAGNMTSNGSATYTYDAENHLTAAGGATYTYDGDGNRVKKMIGTTGTIYWRGTDGQTANETDAANTILHRHVYFAGRRVARSDNLPTWTAHFYFSDALGSANVVTNATGNIEDESDYYPYGGEIVITNVVPQNYKFTGKERDTESGLDNFGARYFTSNIGRFMTPDWAARPTAVPYALFGDPQSLNLYGYVRNDPVSQADADGHGATGGPCYESGPQCHATSDRNQNGDLENAAQNQAQQKYDPKKSGPEDPTNPGHPLSQNPDVKKASDQAFMTTTNGQARSGLAEAGFAIDNKDGKIEIVNKVNSVNGDGKPNELHIQTDEHTIAILHTHGNKALPTPSPGDLKSPVPNFVRSQRDLYVTVPGTTTYIQLQ